MTTYIFFLDGTLLAVVGVRHSWTPADHTAPLVRTVVTLITNAHKSAGPNVGVTDHAFAITCKYSRVFGYRMSLSPPLHRK